MGIKNLNHFLKTNCLKNSIYQINFSELENKKVVIDISIYLYKFLSEDNLIEQLYLLINTFKFYKIKMLFVFDGISPPEKKNLLIERRNKKLKAKNEFDELTKELEIVSCEGKKKELEIKMNSLKKEFIKITKQDIELSKNIITLCGENYIVAPNEADTLCAYLVLNKHADICVSEDMDLLLYGCPYVLRYLSILKKNGIIYNLSNILKDLNINFSEFQDICVLTGTDYNDEKINLFDILNEFKKYAKQNNTIEFKQWFLNNTSFCKNTKLEDYNSIKNMFLIKNSNNLNHFQIDYTSKEVNTELLKSILTNEGFIFAN